MPKRIGLNVSLTGELSAFIQAQVASGQYGSASEVVRASLRLLIQASKDRPSLPTGTPPKVQHA